MLLLSEHKRLSYISAVYSPLVIHEMAVAQGMGYHPRELMSCQWAPFTFRQYHTFVKCPLLTAHNCDVCLVAFSQKSPLAQSEDTCWIMAHELYHAADVDYALIGEREHEG